MSRQAIFIFADTRSTDVIGGSGCLAGLIEDWKKEIRFDSRWITRSLPTDGYDLHALYCDIAKKVDKAKYGKC